eukprot:gb/GECH01010697.1/.p1 GENE.gb/GECH01010697.1/~~gb/GECH01010697.1/.p1  ORF type:complete len:155 (+),score=26.21 gb/GECH01010697.1/:1-465(+)
MSPLQYYTHSSYSLVYVFKFQLFYHHYKTCNKYFLNISLANRIGDRGIKDLSECIKHNNTLSYLALAQNNIGDQGSKYLSEALQVNRSVTKMSFFGNNINDQGFSYLSSGIKQNSSITWIDICDIDPNAKRQIKINKQTTKNKDFRNDIKLMWK